MTTAGSSTSLSPDPGARPPPVFDGVGVALLTLFADDGSLDVAATADLALRLVDTGVKAVVVTGTTGEAATLSAEERVSLLDGVTEAVRSISESAVVVAGTGAPSAHQAEALTAAAVDHGADAVLVLSPPGTDDPRRYYERVVAAAGATPVLAYHFPVASAPGISLAALRQLDVAGCKDSSGDPDRLLETLTTWDRPLYVGSSAYLSLAGPLGCAGAILALANAEPEACIAAFAGDASAQRSLATAHREALVDFPSGIKRLTARRFGTSTVTRTR